MSASQNRILIIGSAGFLIFFSSDYVFQRTVTTHREEDLRAPETCYGRQKLAVEQYLEAGFERYLVFRSSKLMSKTTHPRNILLPVIQSLCASKPIGCFEDQWLNPVFVEDIAEVIKCASRQALSGVYHLGTRRIFTRFELAIFLAKSLGYDPALIQAIRLKDMRFSEPRPTHNTLDCRKIESALGFRFTEIEDAITDLCLLVKQVLM
jgi:dTDP-4-dehydrorhamnose reductase